MTPTGFGAGTSTNLDTDVLGGRVAAQVVDIAVSYGASFLLTFVAFLVLFGGLGAEGGGGASSLIAGIGFVGLVLIGVVNLAIVAGYGIVLEIVWDGQTVGKRLLDVRVVEEDGSVPGPVPVVLRNLPSVFVALASMLLSLLGPLVVYPIMLVVGLAAILVTDDDQRLFDLAADTYVVAA